jgi:hypothetical protein
MKQLPNDFELGDWHIRADGKLSDGFYIYTRTHTTYQLVAELHGRSGDGKAALIKELRTLQDECLSHGGFQYEKIGMSLQKIIDKHDTPEAERQRDNDAIENIMVLYFGDIDEAPIGTEVMTGVTLIKWESPNCRAVRIEDAIAKQSKTHPYDTTEHPDDSPIYDMVRAACKQALCLSHFEHEKQSGVWIDGEQLRWILDSVNKTARLMRTEDDDKCTCCPHKKLSGWATSLEFIANRFPAPPATKLECQVCRDTGYVLDIGMYSPHDPEQYVCPEGCAASRKGFPKYWEAVDAARANKSEDTQ